MLALDYIIGILEKKIFSRKFSLLGGFQLGREVKRMTDFFSQDTNISVRHKFAKLSQIVSILSLEKVILRKSPMNQSFRFKIFWRFGEKGLPSLGD
jgi:hypothetical protein